MSQVSWGRTLALAGALVILGSTAYWLEYSHKPKKEEQEETAKKLFQIKDTSIAEVKLSDGPKIYDLKCLDIGSKLCKAGDNSKWELLEPSKLKADESNSNSLLSSLNNAVSNETIDLSVETPDKRTALLKEYGLNSEARGKAGSRKVELTTASGEKQALYIGETNPIGDSIFAIAEKAGKIDENKVLLIPSYFKSNLDHDLTYWRDKKLLTFPSTQVQSFDLRGSKAQVSGEKKDGKWTLHPKGTPKDSPKGSKDDLAGDIENIDGFLSAATYLTAKNFISENKSDAKAKAVLQGAKTVVTLTMQVDASAPVPTPSPKTAEATKKAEAVTLTLFEKNKLLYATVSTLDPVYELETSSKERVDKDLKDIRLVKLITSMEKFTAKKLTFEGPPLAGTTLSLLDKDNKWTRVGDKTEIDQEKVQGLLDKLSGNRIKEFVGGNAIPAGEQTGLKMTLGDDKSDQKRQIVFWKNGDHFYGKDLLLQRKEAFLIDTAVRDALPWSLDFFKKAIAPSPTPVPDLQKDLKKAAK